MTTGLKEALRNISSESKSEAELDFGVRVLIGFTRCLLSMRQEIMENESNNAIKTKNRQRIRYAACKF